VGIKDQMKATCNTSPTHNGAVRNNLLLLVTVKTFPKQMFPRKEAYVITERRVEIFLASGLFGPT
jgi:hypothetical protein